MNSQKDEKPRTTKKFKNVTGCIPLLCDNSDPTYK